MKKKLVLKECETCEKRFSVLPRQEDCYSIGCDGTLQLVPAPLEQERVRPIKRRYARRA